jgi:uncharacterized protein with GYD domain
MTIMLGMGKFSAEATKGLLDMGPVKREEYFRQQVEGSGQKVLAYFLVEGGEYDVITLIDTGTADDGPSSVATSLQGQAAGSWTCARRYRLHTTQDVEAALASAVKLQLPAKE